MDSEWGRGSRIVNLHYWKEEEHHIFVCFDMDSEITVYTHYVMSTYYTNSYVSKF